MGTTQGKGWSVRVISLHPDDPRYPVAWYIVAESDREAAIAAVRRMLEPPDADDAQVDAVQELPVVFQGRRLQPGEVTYLYRRGAPRE